MPTPLSTQTLPDPLTRDEQIELSKLIAAGQAAQTEIDSGILEGKDLRAAARKVARGEEALNELYTTNLRLVGHWANEYAQKIPPFAKSVVDRDDLFSEGTFGLRRACEKFDPTKGYAFSTYASYWIRQSIARSIEGASAIKVPGYLISEVRMAVNEEEGVEHSELIVDGMRALRMRSLDAQLAEDFTLADIIVDSQIGPEEALFRSPTDSNLYEDVEEIVRGFSERDRRIVEMRLGLGETPASYREISREVGIGANGVRYVVQKRFNDIRNSLAEKGYNDHGALVG